MKSWNILCDFFEKQYTSKNENKNQIDEYLTNIQLEYTLSNDEKLEIDIFPSLTVCKEAFYDMKRNKSPGLDGIPYECYQIF
jgi:hypothetical protein